MATRMVRRSGIAVCLVAEQLGWKPTLVVQAGVGMSFPEIGVMQEAWGKFYLIGFEASTEVYHCAHKNQYPGALYHAVLGRVNVGSVPIYWRDRHKDGTSIHAVGPRSVSVQQVTLDSVLLPTHTIIPSGLAETDLRAVQENIAHETDWLSRQQILFWLDCEGSEFAVLQGSCEFLRYVDVVNVELTANHRKMAAGWTNPRDVHHLLTSAGFKRQWVHTQRVSVGQYDAIYVKPHIYNEEYSCDPF